jgi:heptosyltransferase-1
MAFKNFCIIRSGAIGDVIHTLPMVRILGRVHKNKKIVYAMDESLAPLMSFAKGIDEIYPINLKSNLLDVMNQAQNLKLSTKERFNYLINLQPSLKTKVMSYILNPEKVVTYEKNSKKKKVTSRNIEFKPGDNEFIEPHAWYDFAESYFHELDLKGFNIGEFFPLIEIPLELQKNAIGTLNLPPAEKLMAIIPGVGLHRPHRAWPLKNWVAFLELLEARHPEYINVLIIGGEEEINLSNQLISMLPQFKRLNIINLAGEYNLLGTASVLSACDLVIGGDTGPTHLAGALGVKTLCLFGPTSPVRHAPFQGIGIQANDYKCARECNQKKCGRKVLGCMESLTPEEVWLAMNEDLN